MENLNWSKIELDNAVTFKEEGIYMHIKLLKNIKGRVMAEVQNRGSKLMRPFDFLPDNVQAAIQNKIKFGA